MRARFSSPKWRLTAVLTAIGLALTAACDSGSSPFAAPVHCVLVGGVWNCGTPYAPFPDCTATYGTIVPNAACSGIPDAGTCFTCPTSQDGGSVCDCVTAADGGATWDCVSAMAGCSP